MKLSLIIPARNEQFLVDTIQNLLANIRGDTEILVGLDGYDEPNLPIDGRLRVHKEPESIGQRAMQNKLAKMSESKYVAKVDAHCAFSEGFDIELLRAFEELGDEIVVAPMMLNLWAFDWKCMKCGSRWYQGPAPTRCMKRGRLDNKRVSTSDMIVNEACDNTTDFQQKTVFKPRPDTVHSTSYRFDNMLHFQYFDEYKTRQSGELIESLSLQGSFFMCTRQKYFDLPLCDETWGSWGQQGSEVAIKAWLSGMRVIINKRCWYAHLFRTQPGFSFPYPQNGNSQQRARDICNDIFKNNKWDKAIHQLPWLLDKFWPVPGWSQADLEDLGKPRVPSREIIYYTAHQKSLKVSRAVQDKLKQISAQKDIPIRSVSLKPMDNMGANIHLPLEPGQITYFTQVITALRHSKAEIVYMCEDDALYHESHFDHIPDDDKFHYDLNWWRVRPDGFAAHWDANQVSGLVARREPLLAWYRAKYDEILKQGFDRSYEPGSRQPDSYTQFRSNVPYIDLRTGNTMTRDKWSLDDFRDKSTAQNFQTSDIANIPGWGYDELSKILEN